MADDIIKLYENQRIRTAWDEKEQEWYFSVVDVVGILSDQPDYDHARNYWKVLKNRIQKEGNELVTKCNQLKMASPKDGKRYPTDVANTKVLLRIIQSVPSPKAEPFKMWLAQVGAERIEETIDPEQAIDRALKTYQRKGYSDEWINQRLMSIRVRPTSKNGNKPQFVPVFGYKTRKKGNNLNAFEKNQKNIDFSDHLC